MSGALPLRVMAALLQQARIPAAVSWLLAAVALLLLCLGVSSLALGAVAVSLLAAAGQAYFAARLGFDRALLEALASSYSDPDAALEPLDDALQALGLRAPAAQTRAWPVRWQGMRRLLRGQLLCLILQTVALLIALYGSMSDVC